MNKVTLESIINKILSKKVDFCETFEEESITKVYKLLNGKLDKINYNYLKGIGIRIANNDDIVYGYSNKLDNNSINNLVDNLTKNFSDNKKMSNIALNDLKVYKTNVKTMHDELSDDKKKEYLYKIDKIARSYSDKIVQVDASFYEYDGKVTIANNSLNYVEDNRVLTRLIINVVAESNDKQTNSMKTFGLSGGYELVDTIDIEKEVTLLAESAVKKLSAKPCPSGEMPVIIGPGFGAVIFHEACGHSMEATTVALGTSVLSGKLGEKVASDKVTIIDDGTLNNYWGTTNVDDEGNQPQKNILIENGILKGYLIDELNNRKMNMNITGSGRRENYKYAPTSRMNNTYLAPSTDKIEDMIKSIDYGIYATNMGGGSVDPVTGDFNFSVNEAYLIENGKVTDMVLGGSLIGNTIDILKNVEMVSDDLRFDTGFCGSKSGNVPVTIGEPTIKVSKILVGGN